MKHYLITFGEVPEVPDVLHDLMAEQFETEEFERLDFSVVSWHVKPMWERRAAVRSFVHDKTLLSEEDVVILRGSLRDGAMVMYVSMLRKVLPDITVYLTHHIQAFGWEVEEI